MLVSKVPQGHSTEFTTFTENNKKFARLSERLPDELSIDQSKKDEWIVGTNFPANPVANLWEGRMTDKSGQDIGWVWGDKEGRKPSKLREENNLCLVEIPKKEFVGLQGWNNADGRTQVAIHEFEVEVIHRSDQKDLVRMKRELIFSGQGWMPNRFRGLFYARDLLFKHMVDEKIQEFYAW